MSLAMIATHCTGQPAAVAGNQRQTALTFEQQGDNAKAEAAWRDILKVHPSNPEPYAHLGLLEVRQGHYKEAVLFYRKALALNPDLPGVRMNLGLALFKDEDFKQAIPVFLPLLKSQPADAAEAKRLTILIGMAHYGLGEYAQAIPSLKKASADDAQNLPLRLALAHSCLWAKQYPCVLDTYHEILMLNAESAEADMLAGEALDEMKDTPGAIQQFRAAVKANPREPDVHFGLGFLLWTQTQYPEAASEFQTELDNNPNHVQALTYLGDTQMHLKHSELAQPLLESALRLDGQALVPGPAQGVALVAVRKRCAVKLPPLFRGTGQSGSGVVAGSPDLEVRQSPVLGDPREANPGAARAPAARTDFAVPPCWRSLLCWT